MDKDRLPGAPRIRPAVSRTRFASAALVLVAVLIVAEACRPSAVGLTPGTPLRSVAGYASLKFNDRNASGRSKVSFSIQLPDRARLDVFDVLGRSILILIARGEESYLAYVPQKAYWRGGRDRVFEKFLGFPLSVRELAGVLAWRPSDLPPEAIETWNSRHDRVVALSLAGAEFEVQSFFPGTDTPHILDFRGTRSAGRIKVLEIKFNGRPSEGSFEPRFLEGFASKTWPEMEELLRNEAEVVR
jgi:hypothetical protein